MNTEFQAVAKVRDQIKVARELGDARKQLANNLRGLETQTKPENVAILERGSNALVRKIAALEAELVTAPERRQIERTGGFVLPEGVTLCTDFNYRKTELSPAEIADLGDIPQFLRRAA